MRKLFLALLLSLQVVSAGAAIISRPTKSSGGAEFIDNKVLFSSDLNGDADTIYTDYNGNITNPNISPNAAVAGSKINPQFTANVQITSSATPCFVNIDSSQGANLKQWNICQSGGVLSIATYTDAGAIIITPLSIARATGNITLTGSLTLSALTANSFLYSGTAGLLTSTAAPTNGQFLIGSTGAAPVVAALTGTANQLSVTNGAGSVTLGVPNNPQFGGLTANSFLYSGTSSALTTTAAPTNGQFLIGSTGAAPVAAAITAGQNIAVTNGAGSSTVALTGIVPTGNGGTGAALSITQGQMVIGQSATVLAAMNKFNLAVFSSSGTWTAPTNVTQAVIEVYGSTGGGGGGGSGGSGNANNAGGNGGNGGAGGLWTYASVVATVISGNGYTVTIGAGGTGGAGGAVASAGGNGNAGTTGSTGGTTSVGTLISVVGGTGGTGGGAGLAGNGVVGANGSNGSNGSQGTSTATNVIPRLAQSFTITGGAGSNGVLSGTGIAGSAGTTGLSGYVVIWY